MAEEPNCPHLCEGRHSYAFVANNKDGIAVRQFAPIREVEKKLVLVNFVDVRHSKNVDTVVGQFDENVCVLSFRNNRMPWGDIHFRAFRTR